jgi:hypothetical protein
MVDIRFHVFLIFFLFFFECGLIIYGMIKRDHNIFYVCLGIAVVINLINLHRKHEKGGLYLYEIYRYRRVK